MLHDLAACEENITQQKDGPHPPPKMLVDIFLFKLYRIQKTLVGTEQFLVFLK